MYNKISELNNQKVIHLKEIYNLTVKQKEILANEDLEGLQKLIDAKQKIIDKVDQINLKLEQLGNNHLECNSKMNELAKETIVIDRDNLNIANIILFKLKQKVGKVRQAKKVNKAYNPVLSQSAFINKSR